MVGLRRVLVLGSLLLGIMACQPAKNNQGGGGQALSDAGCGSRTPNTCASNTNCTMSGSTCVGTTTYCKQYKQDSCPLSSCKWSPTAYMCVPFEPFVSQPTTPAPTSTPINTGAPNNPGTGSTMCSSYNSQSTCPTAYGCLWNGYQCVANTPNTGNTGTTPLPNGTNCEALGVLNCWMYSKQCEYRLVSVVPPTYACVQKLNN